MAKAKKPPKIVERRWAVKCIEKDKSEWMLFGLVGTRHQARERARRQREGYSSAGVKFVPVKVEVREL